MWRYFISFLKCEKENVVDTYQEISVESEGKSEVGASNLSLSEVEVNLSISEVEVEDEQNYWKILTA